MTGTAQNRLFHPIIFGLVLFGIADLAWRLAAGDLFHADLWSRGAGAPWWVAIGAYWVGALWAETRRRRVRKEATK